MAGRWLPHHAPLLNVPTPAILFALVLLAAVHPARAQVPPEEPDPDEYAIWSAVLDTLEPGADYVRLLDIAVVPSSTGQPPGWRPTPRLDSFAVDDFRTLHTSGVRLDSRFSTRQRIVLVRARTADGDPELVIRPHLIRLDRPAFDRRRRRAVVTTTTSCETLCGRGHRFELERQPDGRWKITRLEVAWIS